MLQFYTFIERATFLLYNDATIMHERNKYFAIDALKDTWGNTLARFLEFVNIIFKKTTSKKYNPCNIFFKHI